MTICKKLKKAKRTSRNDLFNNDRISVNGGIGFSGLLTIVFVTLKAMQDLIDSQPIAYDIDKVIEQLETRRSLLEVAKIPKSARSAADTAYSLAIGDIRKGGINENR